MVPFDGDYQPQQKSYECIFTISHTVSEILTFQICDLENLSQGHIIQHLQLAHLMANINLYKNRTCAVFACSHRFQDIHISKFVTLTMKLNVSMLNNSSVVIR